MGLYAWQFGGAALAVSMAVSLAGCGKTEDALRQLAHESDGGGGSAQAGQRATETAGGTSERGGAPGSAGTHTAAGGELGAVAGEGGAGGGAGGTPGATEGCTLAHHVEVPVSVQRWPEPSLVKSGSEFATSEGRTLVAMSWSGQLRLQQFNLNDCSTCDALFGVTALRSELGWRMVSFDRIGPNGGPATRAWSFGDQSPPEARPLFGPEYSGLVSEFGVGASRDGKRAVFANGQRVVSQQVTFALVDADGRMVAPASTLEVPEPLSWNYLSIVPTDHAAAVSVIGENDDRLQRVWVLSELDASGQLVFSSQVTFPAGQQCDMVGSGGCGIVEDADGYYIRLHDTTGTTWLARLLRAHPNELAIDHDLMIPPKSGLVAAFPEMLVFAVDESTSTTLRTRFVGIPKSGVGEPRSLALTPGFSGALSPRSELTVVEGNSLFYAVRTRDTLTIEELDCSNAL